MQDAVLRWLGEVEMNFRPLPVSSSVISEAQAKAAARYQGESLIALYGSYSNRAEAEPFVLRDRPVWLVICPEITWVPVGPPGSSPDSVQGGSVDVIDAVTGQWLEGLMTGHRLQVGTSPFAPSEGT